MRVVDRDLIGNSTSAYLIGIGGVGMSALARVLKHRGLRVTGSDARATSRTRALERDGIPVFIKPSEVAFGESEVIIYSSAISEDDLELSHARQLGRKVHHRAEILSSLFNQANTSIGVTGTHGKTTTSSMISYLLTEMGKEPTCLVGGDVMNFGTNTLLGNPNFWVSEVDESDRTHELYAPHYSVITNLEEDHLDNYTSLEDLKKSFEMFIGNTKNPGLVIYCGDDPILGQLVRNSGKPSVSFGLDSQCDYSAQNIQDSDFGCEFDFCEAGFFVTRMKIAVPGNHNVLNALAAMSALIQLGISPEEMQAIFSQFQGAGRRLEVKWESDELMIIDDYAHHPTEVRAAIEALRGRDRRLTVVFQPHRYSRIQHFFKEFACALESADEIILMPIYSAGEANPDNIDSKLIYERVIETGHQNIALVDKQNVLEYLLEQKNPSGIIAFLGAGDIGEIADGFTNRYKNLAKNER